MTTMSRVATIMIEMFDDRVEVSNPGGLLPIVAKDFGHKSMTRNPLIFGLFTRMHLVEKVASGIPRMKEAMKEAGLPEPEFNTNGIFTAVFKRKYSVIDGGANGGANGGAILTTSNEDTINQVKQIIYDNAGINSKKINQLLPEISKRTIERCIQKLREDKIIEFKGASKIGGYYIIKH